MTDKPVMDNADNRLSKLEDKLASVIMSFQTAETNLNPKKIATGLEALAEVREELRTMMGNIIDLRTLAQPANWRLRMQYDTPLYCEFLKLADERILALAIKDCDKLIVEKILTAIGKANEWTDD